MSDVLSRVFPFRFLPPDDRRRLEARLAPFAVAAGQVLIQKGDSDTSMLLLDAGEAEVVREDGEVLATIVEGHYLGERAALFGEVRNLTVRAAGPVEGCWLPGDAFLDALRGSPVLAQAFARILREKQGLFAAFDAFMAGLLHGLTHGALDLAEMLPAYLALDPALHTGARGAAIDTGALFYAVRRLPGNIGTTFTLFLTDDMPAIHRSPDRAFRLVPTAARPRSTYEMMPGKSMVLLRDGISDLIDLVSCLCVYAVEARKIRKRMGSAAALHALGEPDSEPAAVLRSLPFDEAEMAGIEQVWGGKTLSQLRHIAFHHEDFSLRIRKQLNNYNSRHSERWTAQIADAVEELLGVRAEALPDGTTVHVVSSNTHSVANCLSPWLRERSDSILAWAEARGHKMLQEQWHQRADLVYALGRDWSEAHPGEAATRRAADGEAGMLSLEETAFTGIQVGLVDLSRLGQRALDPGIAAIPPAGDRRRLLVNVDFAFGQQAAEIIGALITLFGPHLQTVSILGKAGALQGARGDILHPTAFVDQTQEALEVLPPQPIDLARLRAAVPDRTVHVGPLLTVPGTLLQNGHMLRFYQHLWQCVGLEMEGVHYYRRVDEARRLGLVRPDLELRFLYYVSDLPLDPSSNLSGRMRPSEGIPPLYAVTREILSGIAETIAAPLR